jgi:hypothetical protein
MIKEALDGLSPKTKLYANKKGGVQSAIPYRCDLLPAKALLSLQSYIRVLACPSEYIEDKSKEIVNTFLNKSLAALLIIQQGCDSNEAEYSLYCAAGYILFALEASLSDRVLNIEFTTKSDLTKREISRRGTLSDYPARTMLECAKVLEKGAKSHGPEENWRLISANDHINHAQTHIWAYLAGDKQDKHLSHAAVRLLFAVETDLSLMGPSNPAIKKLLI